MDSIIQKVESALRTTPGILEVKWIREDERGRIYEMEKAVEKEELSMAGTYNNEGIREVLARSQVCVVLNNNDFRHASEPAMLWVSGDQVIGEEISDPIRLKHTLKMKNVKLLSTNFVVYFDRVREAKGVKPRFVVQGLPFPEIEGVKGVTEVISASPIGSADVYLKEKFKWPTDAPELGTILIGFNLG